MSQPENEAAVDLTLMRDRVDDRSDVRNIELLRRFVHWVRYGSHGELVIDKMTDELERALAGERPNLPIHRNRYKV